MLRRDLPLITTTASVSPRLRPRALSSGRTHRDLTDFTDFNNLIDLTKLTDLAGFAGLTDLAGFANPGSMSLQSPTGEEAHLVNHANVTLPWSGARRCNIAVVALSGRR
jgi:hypothetical protein